MKKTTTNTDSKIVTVTEAVEHGVILSKDAYGIGYKNLFKTGEVKKINRAEEGVLPVLVKEYKGIRNKKVTVINDKGEQLRILLMDIKSVEGDFKKLLKKS